VPREVVALVSADDVVAAVRVHADRVHDLLRRSGCGPEESVEVCESYAFALLDALVNAPETVGDMAGWWFGRALELGRRLGETGAEPADEMPTSVLAGTTGEAQVRAALATLPETERSAVMLRDAYDLPPEAVAVALRRDIETASALTAAGRLRLVAAYDDRAIPDLVAHTARTPADLGTLGRLADGSLAPPRTVPLRRHLGSCPACEEVVETLAKGRRLAAALPVLAMPDDAREAMLERFGARAGAVLPSVDEVLLAIEEDDATGPAISPVAVILAIVIALVLGIAVAAATSNRTGGQRALDATPTTLPSIEPSFTATPLTSASPSRTPSATPSTKSSSPAASQSASATASAASTGPGDTAAITLSPAQGPRNTSITIAGTGWTPGSLVTVSYVGSLSSQHHSTTVDARGRFTVTLPADGTLPGQHRVDASDGSSNATATFTQTS
jgi:hypothetical protein